MVHLFVYGTLLSGDLTDFAVFLQQNSRLVGRGSFAGKLYDVGSFPAALWLPDSVNRVHGSLYELHNPELVFAMLDPYEGIDPKSEEEDLYARVLVPITLENGATVAGFVYLFRWPVERLTWIEDGDYLGYLKNK
jgi:gamma-glutamylcyclotransferase (GGCT)/AIG2-like uncharacterized protein YtfP